ncbi:MAG: hypothetical protein ACK5MD_10835 [Flavobacteriales bacterium]
MEINVISDYSKEYEFKYEKTSFYKGKKISEVKSNSIFSLKLKFIDQLQMIFESKKSEYNRQKLVFTPIQFQYDPNVNLFLIKNKDLIRVQWNKFKESNRSSKNNAFLFLYEQLYFKIALGLEYDLLSNGAYLPFFVNIYNKDLFYGAVFSGMSWVHTPLSLPLKIDYIVEKMNEAHIIFQGTITLDEALLIRLLADKGFQKKAKPYHYNKNFSISSDIISTYDIETGYLKTSSFLMKIYSEEEGIDESINSYVVEN